MSTKFYKARHDTDVAKTAQVSGLRADTDSARGSLVLLKALNDIEPLNQGNWTISITNYDGTKTVQKSVNWKGLTMSLAAKDVFDIFS